MKLSLISIMALAAMTFAGCGGGGGGSNEGGGAANSGTPPATSTPTDTSLADKQESTRMLSADIALAINAQHAQFADDKAHIEVDTARAGTMCGSAHQDAVLNSVQQNVEMVFSAAERSASALAASRPVDKADFSKLFEDLKTSETNFYKFPEDYCGFYPTFNDDLNADAVTIINATHTSVTTRLRTFGTIS